MIGFLIFSVFFILFGFLMLNSETYKKFIKFSNSLRGVKTEITDTTLVMGKIGGVVLIVIGVIYFIVSIIVL